MKNANNTHIAAPPRGKEFLKWLGPGFLWMMSAAGSGELLFTPRIGSLYGYSLLWAMVAAVMLKWFINREIGRFTVCTGKTVLEGFSNLPGPANWALYLILVPQLFVAVATIAGLAGTGATALVLAFPGDIRLWTVSTLLAATGLVLWGRFKGVERAATVLAVLLSIASIVAAISIFPGGDAMARGMVPAIPANVHYGEVLPWLGFMLSGAAGMIWYSYWIQEKGYGTAGTQLKKAEKSDYNKEEISRLKGWIRQMTIDNNFAVFGTLIITIAFLVLGVEVLRPRGLVPEENKVAEVLGQLLGQIWGNAGFWFMVLAVFIGFWSTVLSDQDGFGRMFAGGTALLTRSFNLPEKWQRKMFLKNLFVIVLVSLLPLALYLIMGEPVSLLKLAGLIEAAHIPILAGLTIFLNRKKLPAGLRPSVFTTVMVAFSGIFFALFAIIYLLQLTGVVRLG